MDAAHQPERVGDSTEERRVVGLMAVQVGGVEGRHVDGVADGQVHRGVYHVPEGGLVVLDGASLAVAVAKEDELLLLAGPQTTHTFTVHLHSRMTEWKNSRIKKFKH